MTNEFGGAAYGFRYLIPLIPVLWYFAGVWLLEQRSKAVWGIAAVFILWGVAASLAGAYAPFGLAFEGHRSRALLPGTFAVCAAADPVYPRRAPQKLPR